MYIDLINLSDLGLLVLIIGGVAWLVVVALAWVVLHHYCGRNDDE